MFVWTAIYIESQLEDLRKEVLRLAEEKNVRCPLNFLPLHVSLKISFDIPEERVEECVSSLCALFRKTRPFTMEAEDVEFKPGIIWIKMKENEALRDIHARLDALVEEKFGIAPHEFDRSFIYHCTLLFDEDENLRRIYPDIREIKVPAKLNARSFLIGISEDGMPGTFRVYKHSHLGEEFSVRDQWEEFDKDSQKDSENQ